MTTQSRMFFVKSFKGFRPFARAAFGLKNNLHQAKLHGQQIHLGAAGPGCQGFHNPHTGEPAACGLHQLAEARPLEHLDQGATARLQDAPGYLERQLRQVRGARLIDDVHPAQVWRHVRKNDVDLPSRQQPEELIENLLLAEVALHKLDPGKLWHGEDVRGDDPAVAPHPPAGVLTPRSRGGSQIKAGLSGLQQPLAPVDFLELEHRARAPALALDPLHERIGEVLLQPPVAALGTPAHRFSWTVRGISSSYSGRTHGGGRAYSSRTPERTRAGLAARRCALFEAYRDDLVG